MSARVRLLTACIIAIAALRAPCVGAQAPRPPWFHGLSLERATAVALDSISNMLASGRLATADSLAAQLLSSARERRGARSLEMLAALDTVIRVFYAKSYYGPARRYSDRFVSLGEQLLGHDAVSLAPGFSRHSDLCGHVSDFAGARSYAERAVTLAERAPAHDRLELANYIDQLAATYSIENPDSTRALSERALEIRRAALGPDALEVAQSLRKLGIWLRVHGDYVSARERLEEALAIIDRKLARDDPGRCVFYNSYGALLGNSGDLAAAAEQFARCVTLSERAYGIFHYDVARFMNNLGLAYVDMRRFRNAEGCFDSALVIRERIQNLGGVAESQGSIGQLRVREGAYADAIPWLQKSLSYWTRSRPYGISVADMMDELATAYTHLGQYARAESCYALDFQVRDRLTPPGNPSYSGPLNGYAYLRFAMSDATGALRSAVAAESLSREHFILTARALSERQALAYAAHRPSCMNVALSIASPTAPNLVLERIWDSVIRSRGVVLDEMATRHRAISGSADSTLRLLSDSLGTARRRLFGLLTRERRGDEAGPDPALEEARQATDRLEGRLGGLSSGFRAGLARSRAGYAEVTAALPPRSALVAFVRYVVLHPPSVRGDGVPDSQSVYSAFLLRAGHARPDFIPIGPAAHVDSLIEAWRVEASTSPHDPFAVRGAEERCFRAGEVLRACLWDPVARRLKEDRDIYVVPDGSLQFVNLAALPAGRQSFLVEGRSLIHVLSSERDLLPVPGERRGVGLLALGGADFDHAAAPGREMSAAIAAVEISPRDPWLRSDERELRGGCLRPASLRFSRLPGTGREISQVLGAWRTAHTVASPGAGDAHDVTLADSMASEAAFKRLAPGRRVVHLATHGFFLGGSCDSTLPHELKMQNPLLLTGLALAGANERRPGSSDQDDGILTAEEIAGLDLSGVDWAVLSACNTGLGLLRAGEGVLGLRRAFAIAGARTTIMSLWRVEDAATREWMKRLYDARLVRGLTTAASVREASIAILRERRRHGESTHPSAWGAFIASGRD